LRRRAHALKLTTLVDRVAHNFASASLCALFALAIAAQVPSGVPRDTLPARLSENPPLGLPDKFPEPADNPSTPERLALGRKLFFEPRLSVNSSIACASCHQPEHGFAQPTPGSPGAFGKPTPRNAPSLLNRGFGEHFMWDGRSSTLEEQVLLPIENELEMALPLDTAIARLRGDADYARLFAAAFDDGVTRTNLARALATFVRRLTIGDSPVDHFRAGEMTVLSDDERAGLWLYESRGGCWRCHVGSNYTDEDFHNTGVGARDGQAEPGRAAITNDAADRGRFKTPSLRGLALTAPYMHDGSLATLEDVVGFYSRGAGANQGLDPRLQPLSLSPNESRALVAFLRALSKVGVGEAPGDGR
jgi:cytochrome c peroxidase